MSVTRTWATTLPIMRTRWASSVTTTAESDLLIIPYNRFDQILGDNPDLVRSIAEELAERLYAMDEKIS